MTIKKKAFSIMFMLLLSVGIIAGCSNSASHDATESEETNNDTTEQEATSDEEKSDAIVVQADTINSHEVEDAICVVNSRFEQGWRMVFRANVMDAASDEVIENADVKVVLETGEEFEMELGDHGSDDTETMLYTIAWTIPDDFPTGTLDYEIIATVDGEDYVYEPFNVDLSKMTIIEPLDTSEADA